MQSLPTTIFMKIAFLESLHDHSFDMKNNMALSLLILFWSSLSIAQDVYKYEVPKKLDDGWETGSLIVEGYDSAGIYELFGQLQGDDHHIHSALLIKNNKLLLEEYFGEYHTHKQHDLRSVTKSFTSLLLGIAIDKGYIEDVNDPISTYLGELQPRKNLDERKQRLTIKHLVTMSTGLDCNDWDKKSKGQEDKVFKKKDFLQYFLDLPMINEPGAVSTTYCTVGQTLAKEIISRASGMSIDVFAKKYLFDPLQIDNVSWGHTSDGDVIASGKRLYMTPRDMAKMGLLVLNKGVWNGEQIVSEKWLNESTSPKTKITNLDYCYLWWNLPFQSGDEQLTSIVATGNGGQYIMIFPTLDMIAVFTGGAYNSPDDKLPFPIVNKVFLPTVMSGK